MAIYLYTNGMLTQCQYFSHVVENWEDYIPEPPDGGWGWVVMICSFFTSFILDGIAYCFGIFLNDIKSYFGSSTSSTSLANSLLCGMYLLVGKFFQFCLNSHSLKGISILIFSCGKRSGRSCLHLFIMYCIVHAHITTFCVRFAHTIFL